MMGSDQALFICYSASIEAHLVLIRYRFQGIHLGANARERGNLTMELPPEICLRAVVLPFDAQALQRSELLRNMKNMYMRWVRRFAKQAREF